MTFKFCELCRGVGWMLDCRPHQQPITLELIPCPLADCTESGREVATLCVYGEWKVSALHPTSGAVMSLVPVV